MPRLFTPNEFTELQRLHATATVVLRFLAENADMADLIPVAQEGIDRALLAKELRGLRVAYRDAIDLARAMPGQQFAELRKQCLAQLGVDIAAPTARDQTDLRSILARGAIANELEYELVRSVREAAEHDAARVVDIETLDRLIEAFECR